MPRANLHIVLGMGRKRPLLRDTLATTAKQAKIFAVNNTLRDHPAYGNEIVDFDWSVLQSWGYRCVPITISYRAPR